MRSSIIIAGLLALIVGGWILSGQLGGKREAPNGEAVAAQNDAPKTAQAPAAPRMMSVRVRESLARPHMTELTVTGRTEANRSVVLRAETPGRIVKVEAEKGNKVKRGSVIARIDMDARGSRLTEYRSLVAQKQLEFDQATKLETKGFQSKTRLAQAAAELEQAKAQLRMMQVEIEDTIIRAPFGAELQERPVEVGDFVKIGDHVARLVELDTILIVGFVSEREIGDIEAGTLASATLVNGQEVEGVVRYISKISEETTRTFRVEIEVPNPGRKIYEGLTAEIRLPLEEVLTHQLTPALLTLDDHGTIGVKAIDESNRVVFYPIEIIGHTPEGMLLGGLPQRLTLITVGQEFVIHGETVIPVPESEITARANNPS